VYTSRSVSLSWPPNVNFILSKRAPSSANIKLTTKETIRSEQGEEGQISYPQTSMEEWFLQQCNNPKGEQDLRSQKRRDTSPNDSLTNDVYQYQNVTQLQQVMTHRQQQQSH